MCSTPKPKHKVKGKPSSNIVGILSQMDATKRKQFAARANDASERRELKKKEAALKQTQLTLVQLRHNENHAAINKNAMTSKSWHYWLLSATFSEVLQRCFHKNFPVK